MKSHLKTLRTKSFGFLVFSAAWVLVPNSLLAAENAVIIDFYDCLQKSRHRLTELTDRNCYDQLVKKVKQDANNRELALDAAKAVRKEISGVLALPLFEIAFAHGEKKDICKNSHLQAAILEGLRQPANKDTAAEIAMAKTFAFKTCWPQHEAVLVQAVKDGEPRVIQNACSDLMEKGSLKGLSKKKCK